MSDYQNILNNINRYVALNEEDEQQFVSIIRTTRVKRKQLIVQPNFFCSHQSYIEKGAFRSYILDRNGIEHTIQIAIEDWFISDFGSYMTGDPASLFVEALENSIIYQLAYSDVESLCKSNQKFEHYFRVSAQKAFVFSQRRILANLYMTAEERYIEFSNLYPAMIQRIPQYILASYLGMTPEYLSKIRKRLATK